MENKKLHLIKLAVGVHSIEELQNLQHHRYHEQKRKKQPIEYMHITRQMPKRAEELLNGGSVYWVIKGCIAVRQSIMELRQLIINDTAYCGIVLDSEVIPTVPRAKRPFQGWRYLTADDAPSDLAIDEINDAPEAMLRELSELGLI